MQKIIFIVVLFYAALLYGDDTKTSLEFTLDDLKGKPHSLSDYSGKVVIIDFWATWCVTCRQVFPILNELNKTYAKEEVAILGISLDKRESSLVEHFADKAELSYTILHDPQGKTAEIFKVAALPTLTIISPDGEIVYTKQGIDSKEKKELIQQIEDLINN